MKSLLLFLSLVVLLSTASASFKPWTNHGGNNWNQRYVNNDPAITASRINLISTTWVFNTNDSVSAVVTVEENVVYAVDWGGWIYAINNNNGFLLWKRNVSTITGKTADLSRAAPVITDTLVCSGSQSTETGEGGAIVYCLNKLTGATVFATQVHEHEQSIVTQSGTAYDGYLYVGTASHEEAASVNPLYDCCSFDGRFHKIRLSDGVLVGSISMLQGLPIGPGNYSGNGVWGSSPSIDKKRNAIYIGTGNNYDVPQYVTDCFDNAAGGSTDHCIEPGNYIDSIISIDLATFTINWATKVQGYDAWVVPCLFGGANCPDSPGPDYDFGAAPMYIKGEESTTSSSSDEIDNDDDDFTPSHPYKGDRLIIGQKSGAIYCLDPDDGDIVWVTQGGPGGTLGGHNWGGSTDRENSYFNELNWSNLNYTLSPGITVINGSAWVKVRNNDGGIEWTTPVPDEGGVSVAAGPTFVVNDVMFAGSTAPNGPVYAIDTDTGIIIWKFETGASIYGGFSGDHVGCVYVGSGYTQGISPNFTSGHKIFKFCVPVPQTTTTTTDTTTDSSSDTTTTTTTTTTSSDSSSSSSTTTTTTTTDDDTDDDAYDHHTTRSSSNSSSSSSVRGLHIAFIIVVVVALVVGFIVLFMAMQRRYSGGYTLANQEEEEL